MESPKTDVFFYGLFMDPDVLSEKGFETTHFEIAYARGYELVIGEMATLVRSVRNDSDVYGSLMQLDREALKELYSDPRLSDYMPVFIQITTIVGSKKNVISYLVPFERISRRNSDYAKKLLSVGKKLELPKDYLAEIETLV